MTRPAPRRYASRSTTVATAALLLALAPIRGGEPAPTRVAAAEGSAGRVLSARPAAAPAPIAPAAATGPIGEAKRMIAACRLRHESVRDYTCTFFKRERVDGTLSPLHVATMKIRTRPQSVYARLSKPKAGREGIYVAGRNGGKVLVHDTGLGKLLAGTLKVDPRSSLAMEDCRHPITEAGIGHMIETIATAWDKELSPGESEILFHVGARVGNRPCTMIESTHPTRRPDFLFHKVKVFIDTDLGLPIRFEAFDWPRAPGAAPELVEEYTYYNLKLNVGLTDRDFDPANKAYSFGRF